MKDTLQRNKKGFPCGTNSPYYTEKLIFSNLIKYIVKKLQSIGFHVLKTLAQYI